MAAPTYTAIIPAYNAQRLIHHAIQSVLNQTFPPLEIFVVDDGSSDGTREVVQKFPVQYIHQENKGCAAARNTGARHAHGEWLAFLDHDDTWHPEKSEKQLEYAGPGIDAIFCEKSPNSDNITFAQMFQANYGGNPSSMMIRRSTLESLGGFDEDRRLIAAEDYNLWMRFVLAGHRFRTTPQYYSYTPDLNHISGDPERMLHGQLINIEKIGELAALDPLTINRRKQALRREYIPALIGSRKQKLARRHLLHAGFSMADLLKYSAAAYCPRWALDLRRRLRSESSAAERSV
jgi:glycosyltransferase involved in cell wall biosynthesis